MTREEALIWLRTNGVTARREDGRVILDMLNGARVPMGLTAALRDVPDDLLHGPSTPAHVAKTVPRGGLSLKDLMTTQFTPRREFVPNLIIAGVMLLAGRAKIGKSWLVLALALALATGGKALGKMPAEQTGVLLLALEDGPQRLQDRFAALLGDSPAPDSLILFTEWPRLNEGGKERLRTYLTEHPEIGVVIVDTLARIRPRRAKGGDLYEEDYGIGEELKAIADERGIAIVVVCHTRKMAADDPLDEISGTMGLTGGVDNAIVMRRVRGQADAEIHVTGRDIAEEKAYALVWDNITAQWTVAGDAAEFAMSKERHAIIAAIREAGEAMTPSRVSKHLGKNYSTTKNLMRKMAQDGELRTMDGAYSLPIVIAPV